MISKKLSLNKVCIILATTILLLSVVMFSVLYILTKTKAGGERHRGWTSGQIGPKQSKRNAPAQQDAMQTHEITLS